MVDMIDVAPFWQAIGNLALTAIVYNLDLSDFNFLTFLPDIISVSITLIYILIPSNAINYLICFWLPFDKK